MACFSGVPAYLGNPALRAFFPPVRISSSDGRVTLVRRGEKLGKRFPTAGLGERGLWERDCASPRRLDFQPPSHVPYLRIPASLFSNFPIGGIKNSLPYDHVQTFCSRPINIFKVCPPTSMKLCSENIIAMEMS